MSENSTNSNQSQNAMGFEAAIAELETIIRQMEGQQLPLQDALAAFKRGTALLQQCQLTLTDAEQQVRILTEQQTLTSLQDK